MNRPLIALGLALTLGLVGWLVSVKEATIADGRLVLLELAPVDPRSLMQGDYMILRYAMTADMDRDAWPDDGYAVLRVDGDGVGRLVGRHDGRALGEDEVRLRYRRRDRLRIGAESYFFEEGTAAVYDAARYGGLRVDGKGESVLVGLYDEKRRLLEAPAETVDPTP